MNVLFMTSSYPVKSHPWWGTFVRECALSVAGEDIKVIVLVFSPDNKYEEYVDEQNPGIKVITYPCLLWGKVRLHEEAGILPSIRGDLLAKLQLMPYFISSLYYVLRTIRKHKIDIIYAQWFIPAGLICALAKLFTRKKLAVNALGADFYLRPHIITRMSLRFIKKLSDRAVAVSADLAGRARTYGLDPKDFMIIPNMVDVSKFYPRAAKHDGRIIIGIVKRLVPEKNIQDLIYAFEEIPADVRADVKIKIVGDGPQKNELAELIKKKGLNQKIEITGPVSHKKMPDVLSDFDVYVDTSRQEGLATSTLEAMASGLAVVAPDGFGNNDAIEDGDNGLLYSPGDIKELAARLTEIIKRPDRRRQLGEEASKTICAGFSKTHAGRQLKDLFALMLEKQR